MVLRRRPELPCRSWPSVRKVSVGPRASNLSVRSGFPSSGGESGRPGRRRFFGSTVGFGGFENSQGLSSPCFQGPFGALAGSRIPGRGSSESVLARNGKGQSETGFARLLKDLRLAGRLVEGLPQMSERVREPPGAHRPYRCRRWSRQVQ